MTHEDLQQRDATAKKRIKSYADRVRGASKHRFKVGDKVLRRRTQRRKTDTFFETDAWVITQVKGDSFVLSRRGETCMRHTSHIKALPFSIPEDSTELVSEPSPLPPPAASQRPLGP